MSLMSCHLGVALKGNFENVQVTDAATEANIIKSNGTFIAVRIVL